MKRSDLRIGNTILIQGEPFNVDMFMMTMDNLEPIPLTEDWLFLLGFKLDTLVEGQPPVYYITGHYMYIEPINLQPMDGGYPICKYQLQFVHQLQNLYFALTGLELIID
ncbi:hypothetical protein GCM10023149_33470 [Mucilaginibacter gynuensis]|uniref:Uncharacterized protein n=1 Tax=Mucilaginibacter gynuensis TaxID=1302236 RepID=A0ABP8GSR8_9SPHI